MWVSGCECECECGCGYNFDDLILRMHHKLYLLARSFKKYYHIRNIFSSQLDKSGILFILIIGGLFQIIYSYDSSNSKFEQEFNSYI